MLQTEEPHVLRELLQELQQVSQELQ